MSTATLSTSPRTAGYAVVVPGRLAQRRPVAVPTTQVYIRRRLLATLVLATVLAVAWIGAGSVLASRSGDPASAAAARPATSYVVQPGDTLWSIAESHHGSRSQAEYVDVLVQLNHGATIQVGQVLSLP